MTILNANSATEHSALLVNSMRSATTPDICNYVLFLQGDQTGLSRLYGLTACSATRLDLSGIPTLPLKVTDDEFAAWDRASDEAFNNMEKTL